MMQGRINGKRLPNEDVTNYRWHAICVFSGKEQMVADMLRVRGFWPFYPHGRSFRWRNKYDRVRGEKYEVHRARVPGYILIGWPGRYVPWHSVLEVMHVLWVVGCDGIPYRLRDKAVKEHLVPLMARQHQGEWDAPDYAKYMRSRAEFAEGDEVEVVEGSLSGRRFKVAGITDKEAVVFQQMFGRDAFIKIPLADLVRAS